MKHIRKGDEPNSLKTYRSTPNATYGGCDKKDIREALLKEQGGICAYCMQRISGKWNAVLDRPYTQIEHYRSQDVFNGLDGKPDLSLNYTNMLGVCNGNSGQPKKKLHCDQSKDSADNKQYLPLSINPLNPNCETMIQFKGSGKISSKNPKIDHEVNVVLNLNERNLVENRKLAIEQAILSIISKRKTRKHQKTEWRISDIKTELKRWKMLHQSKGIDLGVSNVSSVKIGLYLPYCQAVIYYLEEKLRKLN